MKEGPEHKGLTRRDALKTVIGASLSVLATSKETLAGEMEYLPSSLDQKELDEQKMNSAGELVVGFWKQPEARMHITRSYLHGALDRTAARDELLKESTMYVPTPEMCADVVARNSVEVNELAAGIPKGKFGLLLDGDMQRLYLMHKNDSTHTQFMKGYVVSTSKGDWSNTPDSRGTPLGRHSVAAMHSGILGELVSSPQRGMRDFAQIPVHEHGHLIKRPFARSLESNGDAVAEIITAALLLAGEHTPSTRGIFIHGTNRVDLLGKTASGGCVRTSNVDIHDLLQYMKIGRLRNDEHTVVGGTPVMICGHNDAEHPRPGMPPHWTAPKEAPQQRPPHKPEVEKSPPAPKRTLPPRWNPPE